jgi:5-methylcytosine-specific restriction enzyme subunit McrC
MKLILAKNLIRFENVSDEVNVREVVRVKGNKLFREYQEAIRLAKIIIRYFDYNINKSGDQEDKIVPFTLDMSLLYEHYVYGLLYEAYHHDITYQFKGKTGYPDFLYQSENYKAILDAKYIPKYQGEPLDNYVIRQLSGYSRDLTILKYLGYPNLTETSHVPDVPCIILYPTEGNNYSNPFLHKQLEELCSKSVIELSQFYKISIPIPILKQR